MMGEVNYIVCPSVAGALSGSHSGLCPREPWAACGTCRPRLSSLEILYLSTVCIREGWWTQAPLPWPVSPETLLSPGMEQAHWFPVPTLDHCLHLQVWGQVRPYCTCLRGGVTGVFGFLSVRC